jgi:uncharacterized protein YlxW (UPF0749 family)
VKGVLAVLGILLLLGFATAQHTQNLEGYDELREAVLLKKMNQIRAELKALEERVTALEEEHEPN